LSKEFYDQSRTGVFLHFYVFLLRNEFLGPKKEKNSLNRVKQIFSSNKSVSIVHNAAIANWKRGRAGIAHWKRGSAAS
jgi:hypothetical protein